MHDNVTLTPFALYAGFLVRYGVPVACAVLAVDAARRPVSAYGRFGRTPWVVAPVALLLALVAGFLVPGTAALHFVAIGALPAVIVYAFVYGFRVVFPRPVDAAA